MFNDKVSLDIDQQNKQSSTNFNNQVFNNAFNNQNMETDNFSKNILNSNNQKEINQQNSSKVFIKDSDIHHMPDKFLKPEDSKKDKKNIFLILGIILALLIILAIGAFAYFALQNNNHNTDVLKLDSSDVNDDDSNDNSADIDLSVAKNRDLKRITDILEIKSALSFYYNDLGKYPYYLSSLKKYLLKIPSNPSPGGEEYVYELKKDGVDYILTFALEEGGNLGNLILKSGKYQLSPSSGISVYSDDLNLEKNSNEDSSDSNDLLKNPNEDSDNPNADSNEESSSGGLLAIPPKGADDDDDGLTNVEELLFNTKIELPDSDFDGYSDSEELIALYDPLRDGARLIDNTNIINFYKNEHFSYSVLYPAKWTLEEKSSNSEEIMFYSNSQKDDDFFKIQVNDNPGRLSIQRWYSFFSPNSNLNSLEHFKSPNVVGLKTKDGFNVYIAQDDKVYIISYILLNTEKLNYFKTFEMFVNSFRLE